MIIYYAAIRGPAGPEAVVWTGGAEAWRYPLRHVTLGDARRIAMSEARARARGLPRATLVDVTAW